jgi:hypothetical protein
MKDFVTSSALTRLLANVFMFIILLGAVLIGGYEVINNQPLNPIVTSIASGGIAYACTLLGVHVGIMIPTPNPDDNKTKPL